MKLNINLEFLPPQFSVSKIKAIFIFIVINIYGEVNMIIVGLMAFIRCYFRLFWSCGCFNCLGFKWRIKGRTREMMSNVARDKLKECNFLLTQKMANLSLGGPYYLNCVHKVNEPTTQPIPCDGVASCLQLFQPND